MRSLWCLPLVLLFACKDDAKRPTVEPPSALSLAEICELRATATRSGNLCFADPFTHADFSDDALQRACRPGTPVRVWAESLLAAEASGRIAIDWEVARRCRDASRELREQPGVDVIQSGLLRDLADGDCGSFFTGLVATGESCQDDWDCARGQGCVTSTPLVAGSRTCQPLAQLGEACETTYFPCAEDLYCSGADGTQAGECVAKLTGGEPCEESAECLSDFCQPDTNTCFAFGTVPMGGACEHSEECEDYTTGCVSCRADSPVAQATCRAHGGEGDACESWDTCALDLGCTDSVCTTVGDGADCLGASQAVCAAPLGCVLLVACWERAAVDCEADASCVLDGEVCANRNGTCVVLPESGPCAGGACGRGFYCDEEDQCQARVGQDEACVPETFIFIPGPKCQEHLTCNSDGCDVRCLSDLDCDAGEVCYLTESEDVVPYCMPKPETGCMDALECGAGNYCYIPDDVCLMIGDSEVCEAQEDCDWQLAEGCKNLSDCPSFEAIFCGNGAGCGLEDYDGCREQEACHTFDSDVSCVEAGCHWNDFNCTSECGVHDFNTTECAETAGCMVAPNERCVSTCTAIEGETACGEATGCAWGGLQRCVDAIDCTTVSDEETCAANESCYFQDAVCVAEPGAVSECRELQPTGATSIGYCQVGQPLGFYTGGGSSQSCESGLCWIENEGELAVCMEKSNYGCGGDDTTTKQILGFTFLFGLVVVGRRRRR